VGRLLKKEPDKERWNIGVEASKDGLGQPLAGDELYILGDDGVYSTARGRWVTDLGLPSSYYTRAPYQGGRDGSPH